MPGLALAAQQKAFAMPFDSFFVPSSQHAVIDQPRSRRLEALSLGVFQFAGEWKVYSTQGPVSVYPSRGLALSMAESLALDAIRGGRRVELFVEDEDGDLRQAAIELQ
jgi:hypothetical protein